jgi:hypothetical protein
LESFVPESLSSNICNSHLEIVSSWLVENFRPLERLFHQNFDKAIKQKTTLMLFQEATMWFHKLTDKYSKHFHFLPLNFKIWKQGKTFSKSGKKGKGKSTRIPLGNFPREKI